MLEISNLVGSDATIAKVLNQISSATRLAMGVEISSIYLWDEDRKNLVMRSSAGFPPELIGKASFAAGQGIPGWVAETGEIASLADGTKHPHYDPLPSTRELELLGYLCAPLRIRDEVIGVMTVRSENEKEFSDDEIMLYVTICNQVAIVIEKARMSAAQLEAEKLAALSLSLTGIAHYIKNVLTMMRGGEFLIEGGLKREKLDQVAEGWHVLKRSNKKIAELVENMLNYYRDTEPQFRKLDVNDLILSVMGQLEDRAIRSNVSLLPDLDLRIEDISVDPSRIEDVMANLITNAIEACPQNGSGTIFVRSRYDSDRGRVRVSVIDNGSGIPPDKHDRIFKLFYSTKGKKGTGIGLAASRKIIMEHGGRIDFESTPGKSTEFFFHLPTTRTQL